MIKFNYKDIPESLRERRGERALITVWFGIIPLLFGSYGLYSYFSTTEQSFVGKPDAIFYQEQCGDQIVQNHCLYLVVNQDTLHTYLSEDQVEKSLKIIDDYELGLRQELKKVPEYDKSRRKLSTMKYQTNRMAELFSFVDSAELIFANSVIKSLTLNNTKITSYQNGLFWGIVCIVIGIAWMAVHISFYIKDPYKVYSK